MIAPTGLISRLFTFVMAACLTTLVILIATLYSMFPLERTQVFFLTSRPANDQFIKIEGFDMSPTNMQAFKERFIREYMVARNQIVQSNNAMQIRWRPNGLVHSYSSLEIFQEFIRTNLWRAIMENRHEPLFFRCDVSFGRIRLRTADTFEVNFAHICRDVLNENPGQSISNNFTIAVTVEFQPELRWNERLDNPLGLKVVGYVVEQDGRDGNSDPLDGEWIIELSRQMNYAR